jgi:predicted nucleic acid-binding protein
VIDASIALRWLLPDPLSEACWKLYARIAEAGDQITVPALWVNEVLSGLTKAVYFGSLR